MANVRKLFVSSLYEVFMMDKGIEFTLKDLLGKYRSEVKTPQIFEESFRKRVESMGIATLSNPASDNLAVYTRKAD